MAVQFENDHSEIINQAHPLNHSFEGELGNEANIEQYYIAVDWMERSLPEASTLHH